MFMNVRYFANVVNFTNICDKKVSAGRLVEMFFFEKIFAKIKNDEYICISKN